eukprot:g43772.t1
MNSINYDTRECVQYHSRRLPNQDLTATTFATKSRKISLGWHPLSDFRNLCPRILRDFAGAEASASADTLPN